MLKIIITKLRTCQRPHPSHRCYDCPHATDQKWSHQLPGTDTGMSAGAAHMPQHQVPALGRKPWEGGPRGPGLSPAWTGSVWSWWCIHSSIRASPVLSGRRVGSRAWCSGRGAWCSGRGVWQSGGGAWHNDRGMAEWRGHGVVAEGHGRGA